MSKEEDMSNTFVSEVGQRSAIFKKEDEIESLDNTVETTFPEVKIDPPSEMPSVLEEKKEESTKKVEEKEEDEEFLEAKKKKKSKKYKKRNPFVMFLIMVICLALGAGASYYYFEVYTENDVKEENKEESKVEESKNEVEEIKPTSLFIEELISNYDHSAISNVEIYSKLYANEKTSIKDLDETYLRTLAAKKANRSLGTATFSSDDFQNSVTKLFGDQLVLEDESISVDGGCTKVEYLNSYYHTTIGECGGASAYSLVRKVVKAVKTDSTLEVNVAVAITDGNKVYKGYVETTGGTDELTDVVYASFDIEKDYTKLNQYKYTFSYDDENNNYYLTTIELVK